MMTHIGGYPGRYEKKVKEILEDKRPDIFISGNSHILKVMNDRKLGLLHMNPGAAGNFGWHKVKTILTFNIDGKEIKDLKVIEFPISNPIEFNTDIYPFFNGLLSTSIIISPF